MTGTYFNLNYFYSPIRGEMEFLGIERRLQTNIHDFVTSVPAKQQMEIDLELQNIEVGHTSASIRESLLDKVFKIGDDFTAAVKREYPPGIIGPISLQCIVTVELDFVVYDVSESRETPSWRQPALIPNITTVALWVRAEELQWKLKTQYNKEGSRK